MTQPRAESPASFSCLNQNEQLPNTFAPGSKYRGAVVLDVSSPNGTLIYNPGFSRVGGWEWVYPAS
ncbi:hypothetical protein GCM10023215_21150 [Pseudonocardia yuanmonensis]|uniref:Uncharacterized protein n=1 Tax=Pseudonocardia yuanmonensis TaxID=1095914 RepID=A0ABP8WAX6_9PSEU